VLPVDIRLSAHSSELRFRPRAYSYIGSVPMLDIFDKPINDWDKVAKRAFDIVFSLLGIALFSPVMLATAIAIKLDSAGRSSSSRSRHGFNNELIEVYKFRSMYVDQLRSDGQEERHQERPARDPRRPLHPQDVDRRTAAIVQRGLQGQSVACRAAPARGGTAKAATSSIDEVVDGYFARHKVKPGITGWAQINGWRGEIDTRRKDPAARRIRPLLHRELVALVRPQDPVPDAGQPAQGRKTPIERGRLPRPSQPGRQRQAGVDDRHGVGVLRRLSCQAS
jgi:lipopolysaccharide/colanic/teichoic acid biosynthesis glycosyltransferase